MDLDLAQYQQLNSWFLTAKGKRWLQRELAEFNLQLAAEQGSNLLIIGNPVFAELKNNFSHCELYTFERLYKKIPYPDQSFDAIILAHILPYVSQPKIILQEAIRLLRPNGILIVSDFVKPIAVNYVIKQLEELGLSHILYKKFSIYAWQRYFPGSTTAYIVKSYYNCYSVTPLRIKFSSLAIATTKISLAL